MVKEGVAGWGLQAALWLSDPERSSDPLLGELDTTCQPYILFNASSSGFVRKVSPLALPSLPSPLVPSLPARGV